MSGIRTFVSHLPRPLLRKFLDHENIDVPDQALGAGHDDCARAVKQALAALPERQRGKFNHAVQRIDLMSTEFGEIAIRSVSVDDRLWDLPSRHARAMWLYLHDYQNFQWAEESRLNDVRRGGRDWTTFVGERACTISNEPASLEKFKADLRELFECRHVHVEIFERSRNELDTEGNGSRAAQLTQLTIYREAPPNTELAFSPDGELGTEVRRSVLEASVTYDSDTGHIECVSRHTDSRQQIARIVAVNLLGCAPDFQPPAAQVYDLGTLRQSFAFRTEPIDRIESVRVTNVKLTPPDTLLETVTLETKPTNPRDIWAVAAQRLGPNALQTDYQIAQAKIVIRYKSPTDNRLRSLPIVITPPNRSNLKDHLDIDRLIASKYLPRWGLVVSNGQ
jgi:hypothetical protein